MTKLDKRLEKIKDAVKSNLIDALYKLDWENDWDESLSILTKDCVPQISAAIVLIQEED